jgi:hypothetical protein
MVLALPFDVTTPTVVTVMRGACIWIGGLAGVFTYWVFAVINRTEQNAAPETHLGSPAKRVSLH